MSKEKKNIIKKRSTVIINLNYPYPDLKEILFVLRNNYEEIGCIMIVNNNEKNCDQYLLLKHIQKCTGDISPSFFYPFCIYNILKPLEKMLSRKYILNLSPFNFLSTLFINNEKYHVYLYIFLVSTNY